jgi:hypothetical protein
MQSAEIIKALSIRAHPDRPPLKQGAESDRLKPVEEREKREAVGPLQGAIEAGCFQRPAVLEPTSVAGPILHFT